MGADYTPGVKPPQYMARERLAQVNPVQNDWYLVYTSPGPVVILCVNFRVNTADETIEVRQTIDGIPTLAVFNAIAGTDYSVIRMMNPSALDAFATQAAADDRGFLVLARNTYVLEIRKTTALGAGNLYCTVQPEIY